MLEIYFAIDKLFNEAKFMTNYYTGRVSTDSLQIPKDSIL
jgi:hypothetical protein